MTTSCNRLQLITKFGVRCMSSTGKSDLSCKLLILGGGAGGCSTAAKFASKLGKDHVIVVDPSDVHYYQPMFTLVGGGIKKVRDSVKPMSSVLPKNAKWVQDSVAQIFPKENYVKTGNGLQISYEYLVVALGIEMHFEKVKGLAEALQDPCSGVSSNYSPLYAERTFENLSNLKKGNAVFSFPNTPVKCAGAPLKACFISEHYTRKVGRRDDVNFYYRTSLPVIFSAPHYAKVLLRLCEERGIDVAMKKELIEVDTSCREAKFRTVDNPNDIETIQYSMLHAVPPMAPPAVLAKSSPELVDQTGYLKVNKTTLKHDNFPNVFGIGDCTNLPTSKTAAAVAGQVGILYQNLSATMEGKQCCEQYDGYTSCPLVTGFGTCIMAEFDYNLQPLETFPSWFDQSREHRTMYIMKKDVMPILYWQGMLNGYWNGPKIIRKIMHLGQTR